MIDEPTEEEERHQQIGRMWTEDSSLEKWFPLTAEELTTLRARVRELEERLADQVSLTDAFRVSEANFDAACDKLKARIRELEGALPDPTLILAASAFLADQGVKGAAELLSAYDRIEKVMKEPKEN